MTHNPINALEIIIVNTKHTQHAKTYFQKPIFQKTKNTLYSKNKEESSKCSAFYADC